MYKVTYLPTAYQQLSDAVSYLAEDLEAPDAAEHLLEEVDAQAVRLSEMPYRFPIYPSAYAMKQEIRFFPVKNYMVFYVIHEERKTVEIWRLIHQRQKKARP